MSTGSTVKVLCVGKYSSNTVKERNFGVVILKGKELGSSYIV
jgi:hypothetical protein